MTNLADADPRLVQQFCGIPFSELDQLEPGRNVLIEEEGRIHVLKYEGYEYEVVRGNRFRHNRHTYVLSIGTALSRLGQGAEKLRHFELVQAYALVSMLGTHCLTFVYDREFDTYRPESYKSDAYLRIAEQLAIDAIRFRGQRFAFVLVEECVRERLQQITRPRYFTEVIAPFLEGRATHFMMPHTSRRLDMWGRLQMQHEFTEQTQHLPHGAFVYVGSRHEVYLMGVARDGDGFAMMGTYTASARPPLLFSNNYLGSMSRTDAERPLWRGSGPVNVAEYRTQDPPGFGGTPFIFPHIGRRQWCKNTIFTGEPEVITGDLDEALAHFATTDFAEFSDLVEHYAATMDDPPPADLERDRRHGVFI